MANVVVVVRCNSLNGNGLLGGGAIGTTAESSSTRSAWSGSRLESGSVKVRRLCAPGFEHATSSGRSLSHPARVKFVVVVRADAAGRGGGGQEEGGRGDSTREREVEKLERKDNRHRLSLGDQLLDYIEGGPKLRKWYGAGERGEIMQQQQQEQQEEERDDGYGEREKEDAKALEENGDGGSTNSSEDEIRDAVLVTDADSLSGQLIILSLILQRTRVRALVKNEQKAIVEYGPYVEPIEGHVDDLKSVGKALKGVSAVICPTRLGVIGRLAKKMKVDHIVLLSQVGVTQNSGWMIGGGGGGGGLGSFFGGGMSLKQQRSIEEELMKIGTPYTVVRVGKLRDEPEGQSGFNVGQGDNVRGSISRVDAAAVCVKALAARPQRGLVFEVVNGNEGIDDWSAKLRTLTEETTTTGT